MSFEKALLKREYDELRQRIDGNSSNSNGWMHAKDVTHIQQGSAESHSLSSIVTATLLEAKAAGAEAAARAETESGGRSSGDGCTHSTPASPLMHTVSWLFSHGVREVGSTAP